MSATLRELADRFGCTLHGAGDASVSRVATLSGAGPDSVTFLANPGYRSRLADTRAGAVILEERYREDCPVACLVTANPYATYARIAGFLHPPRAARAGIHSSAIVAEDADIAASAEIGPHAVVGSASVIGEFVIVGPGAVIGEGVRVGEGTRLAANCTVLDGVKIGRRCVLHPGAVIGADGFGFAQESTGEPGAWVNVKIPQIGSVEIGDDVEIGACSAVDRGTIEDTVIEDGVKIDNFVQIGHNVRVGAHTVMASMAGAAGSTKIGKRCMIAGGAVFVGHLDICDDAVFLFRSVITRSISEPGVFSGSLPAEEASLWRRNAARFKHLDEFVSRLRALERRVAGFAKKDPFHENGDNNQQ